MDRWEQLPPRDLARHVQIFDRGGRAAHPRGSLQRPLNFYQIDFVAVHVCYRFNQGFQTATFFMGPGGLKLRRAVRAFS